MLGRAFLFFSLLFNVVVSATFSFTTNISGWNVRADSREILLTWIQSGVVWRSPLLSVGTGEHITHVNTGCWSHKIDNQKVGQESVLESATIAGKAVNFVGKVVMPSGAEERWTMKLSVAKAGAISFAIHIDNSERFPAVSSDKSSSADYNYNSFEVSLRWMILPTERIVGAGEQYSTVDLNGQQFQLWSGEQGIGRGLQPITFALNKGCKPCGGDKYTTYSFVPVLLSSLGYGVVMENSQLTTVDLTSSVASMTISFEDRLDSSGLDISGHILGGSDIRSLLPVLTNLTGRMSSPPSWMLQGLIVGTEGGHEVVSMQIDSLLAAKVPVAGVWVQDWSGMLELKNGKFVWWNWQLDEERYPKAWFRGLAGKGIKVLTYVSPFLTSSNRTDGQEAKLFYEAQRLGHLLTDRSGEVMLQTPAFANFEFGMVNLFKEDTRQWWAKILRCNVMMACDDGVPLVHAWMNDYAEYLPLSAGIWINGSLGTGMASDVHNQYPGLSSAAALAATEGFPEVTFLARSGDLRSPGTAKMFWLGDQLTTWDACDGMQSALIGAMSGGLSGWTLNHVDVGGFTMIDRFPWVPLPGIHFQRTADMLVRWMELGVFMNTIFRSHPGLVPSKSSQPWDPDMLNMTRGLSELFRLLAPYRVALFKEAETIGLPPVRHGMLVHPEDSAWFNETGKKGHHKRCNAGDEIGLSQFFFGDDVIVAPVLQANSDSTSAYLPKGTWTHMWTGKSVVGPLYSWWFAPPGHPAVFIRASSSWASFFMGVAAEYNRTTGMGGITHFTTVV